MYLTIRLQETSICHYAENLYLIKKSDVITPWGMSHATLKRKVTTSIVRYIASDNTWNKWFYADNIV